MHKTVHQDGAGIEEVVSIHVPIACQPIGAQVVDAGGFEFEKRVFGAGIVLIGDGGELVVNAVDVVCLAVFAHIPAVGFAVGVEHAEVIVEGMVLLQHEDDVADGL